MAVFNFICLGGNKTPACVCESCLGPLNRPHLLWGPALCWEVQHTALFQAPNCLGMGGVWGGDTGVGWHH